MLNYTVSKITSQEYNIIPILNITYGKVQTKYGPCILAISDEEKLCFVYFGDDYNLGFKELKHIYPLSNFVINDKIIAELIHYFESDAIGNIHLLLKGTNFQIKVWEYILSIPKGSTVSYEEVAKGIDNPKAVRAVANAVARNNISYFVPCHRIISKSCNLHKYRWGTEMKKQMLLEENCINFIKNL